MDAQSIKPFLFEGEALVRVIDRDGEPWFVLADVCRAVGIVNPRDAAKRLDADEKGVVISDTLGGKQEITVVSEGGLFSLVLRSQGATKPGTVAHRFRKWVTSEVLPSIRRAGRYEEPKAPQQAKPEPAPLQRKPYDEWTLEEIRTRISVVTRYQLVLNNASAAWRMEQEGFPMPPPHLLPAWRQAELRLMAPQGHPVTIILPAQGGSPH